MRNVLAVLAIIVLTTCLAACGGSDPIDPAPNPSNVLAIGAGGTLRIYAGPGSADAGSIVRAVAGATGQATVDADGGFAFDAIPANAASGVSQATLIKVEYTKQGVVLTADCAITQQSSRVTTPLFSTGSAPNDMIFGNDSLYVANSMDNTVVRYELDGSELSTASLGENVSPSYLGLSDDYIWVVCNGINMFIGFDPLTLEAATMDYPLLIGFDTIPAFAGPGKPACGGSSIFIPLSVIESFGETTIYGNSVLQHYDVSSTPFEAGTIATLSGRNGQAAVYSETKAGLFVTSAGEIQFDEFWSPHVTTDSYLDLYVIGGGHLGINLGRIGAGSIAISPDEKALYIGNAINGNLYKVDLAEMQIARGEDNPIVLTTEFTYISDVAFTPDGKYVLATSFNTDELYVIDAETDTVNPGPYPAPFDLSLDPELMAGCLGVEVNPTADTNGGYTAYVLYAIANAVAKVKMF